MNFEPVIAMWIQLFWWKLSTIVAKILSISFELMECPTFSGANCLRAASQAERSINIVQYVQMQDIPAPSSHHNVTKRHVAMCSVGCCCMLEVAFRKDPCFALTTSRSFFHQPTDNCVHRMYVWWYGSVCGICTNSGKTRVINLLPGSCSLLHVQISERNQFHLNWPEMHGMALENGSHTHNGVFIDYQEIKLRHQ